jgi:hypothetical protein
MLDEEQTPFYEGKQNIGGIEDQGFWTLFLGAGQGKFTNVDRSFAMTMRS